MTDQLTVEDLTKELRAWQKAVEDMTHDLRAWRKAVEDARTTIHYLEQRGKEKTKIIRELQARITELVSRALNSVPYCRMSYGYSRPAKAAVEIN